MAKYLCIWVRANWFSVTSFSKWLPGGHIRFFGFWMAWFRQRNSSLLWKFSFQFHVHVLCGCGQKPNDCQLCRFKNGCLVIFNNVQLQSTHCPLLPSPMGRGYPSITDLQFLVWSVLRNTYPTNEQLENHLTDIYKPHSIYLFSVCKWDIGYDYHS